MFPGTGGVRLTVSRVGLGGLLRVELPLLALLSIFFLVTLLVSPGQELRLWGINLPSLIFCPFYVLTGIPCLTCGITRSFLAMGDGNLSAALVFHPLGPLSYFLVVAFFVVLAFSAAARIRIRVDIDPGLRRRLVAAGGAILVAAWLVKLVVWHQVGLLGWWS